MSAAKIASRRLGVLKAWSFTACNCISEVKPALNAGLPHLRRHVGNRPQRSARAGDEFFQGRGCGDGDRLLPCPIALRQSEVQHFGMPQRSDKYVGWLEIAVDDAFATQYENGRSRSPRISRDRQARVIQRPYPIRSLVCAASPSRHPPRR